MDATSKPNEIDEELDRDGTATGTGTVTGGGPLDSDVLSDQDEEGEEEEEEGGEGSEEVSEAPSEVPAEMPAPREAIKIPIGPISTDASIHPVQRLQYQASVLSGLTLNKAFAIDDLRLGHKLGEYYTSEIALSFYKKVSTDPDSWFREMFSAGKLETMAQHFGDFLLQRLGGANYYSESRGTPALGHRHRHVEMTTRTAEKWLIHMESALDELNEEVLEPNEREALLDYFRFTAYFLVATQEAQWEHAALGSQDQQVQYA